MYSTPLESQCMIAGSGILETYGYATGRTGKWVSALSLLEYSPMAMFLEPPLLLFHLVNPMLHIISGFLSDS